ncbi:hypothetical protein HOC01_00320 [archaeon]|jgi:hypothetical protein|nr:hypothetical protein [archaeon]MBT6698716.1 hypothetical protein [archaeon]
MATTNTSAGEANSGNLSASSANGSTQNAGQVGSSGSNVPGRSRLEKQLDDTVGAPIYSHGAGGSNGANSSANGGPKRMLFVGDPHGRFDALKWVTEFAKNKGIEDRVWLGDFTHTLSSAFSKSEAAQQVQFRQSLLQELGSSKDDRLDSSLLESIKKGEFSDGQLQRFLDIEERQKKIVTAHAKATYEAAHAIDPKARKLAGNWDVEKPFFETFGESAMHNELLKMSGMDVLALGGAGSTPIGTAGTWEHIFMSDDLIKEKYRIEGMGDPTKDMSKLIATTKNLDMVIDHVGLPKIKGQTHDQHSHIFKQMLAKRHSLGLEMPKVVVNGHTHLDHAEIEFRRYKDARTGIDMKVLNFVPGVLAKEHNEGTQGTFCIAEFDDNNKIVAVDEYRVLNGIEGIMKVVYHGKHTIDYEKEKVDFKEVGEVVVNQAELGSFKASLSSDKNYELSSRGFDTKYEGLSGKEKDLKLRQNLALIDERVEEAQELVNWAFNSTKWEWDAKLKARDSKDSTKLKSGEVYAVALGVFEKLAKKAAEKYNVNLDEIDCSSVAKIGYLETLVKAAFGIGFSDLLEGSKVDDDDFANAGHDWGSSVYHPHLRGGSVVKRKLNSTLQQSALSGLEGEDFLDMVDEVYAAQNVKRTGELSREDAIGLYSKGFGLGLVSSHDLVKSGAYKKLDSKKGNTRTDKDIREMFDIGENKVPKTFETGTQRQVASGDLADRISKKISNGATKVFSNQHGDYVLGQVSEDVVTGVYLDDATKESINYETKSIKDMLTAGTARVVRAGGDYAVELMEAQGTYIAVDWKAEGIKNPTEYTVVSKLESIHQAKEKEQSKLAEVLRKRDQSLNNIDAQDDPLLGTNPFAKDKSYLPNTSNSGGANSGLSRDYNAMESSGLN